ncbi:MAG TPA: hypothetical protein VE397_02445 [Stellaceae bacterium]|nr:hypothetical protein [Stellaceae bacterium]
MRSTTAAVFLLLPLLSLGVGAARADTPDRATAMHRALGELELLTSELGETSERLALQPPPAIRLGQPEAARRRNPLAGVDIDCAVATLKRRGAAPSQVEAASADASRAECALGNPGRTPIGPPAAHPRY